MFRNRRLICYFIFHAVYVRRMHEDGEMDLLDLKAIDLPLVSGTRSVVVVLVFDSTHVRIRGHFERPTSVDYVTSWSDRLANSNPKPFAKFTRSPSLVLLRLHTYGRKQPFLESTQSLADRLIRALILDRHRPGGAGRTSMYFDAYIEASPGSIQDQVIRKKKPTIILGLTR
jgi:hypothetical protein